MQYLSLFSSCEIFAPLWDGLIVWDSFITSAHWLILSLGRQASFKKEKVGPENHQGKRINDKSHLDGIVHPFHPSVRWETMRSGTMVAWHRTKSPLSIGNYMSFYTLLSLSSKSFIWWVRLKPIFQDYKLDQNGFLCPQPGPTFLVTGDTIPSPLRCSQ